MPATVQLDVTIPETVADGAAMLSLCDVAQITRLSVDTLKALNLSGDGPDYTEDHGQIRYTLAAVREFQAQRSTAHKRLMESYGGVCAHGNTVPALVGFAFGIADCPCVARIGNGLYCRVGKGK
jgi:hypothetical protein